MPDILDYSSVSDDDDGDTRVMTTKHRIDDHDMCAQSQSVKRFYGHNEDQSHYKNS